MKPPKLDQLAGGMNVIYYAPNECQPVIVGSEHGFSYGREAQIDLIKEQLGIPVEPKKATYWRTYMTYSNLGMYGIIYPLPTGDK